MRRVAPLAALGAALLACETRYECPGEPVASLRFQGYVKTERSTLCGEAAPSSSPTPTPPPLSQVPNRTLDFTGSIVRRGGQAVLCVERPLAQEKLGTLDAADALAVSSSDRGLTVGKCPCKIDATEVVTGNLIRTSGAVTGFGGKLVTTLRLSPGASCSPGTTDACEPLALAAASTRPLLPECVVEVDLRAPPQ